MKMLRGAPVGTRACLRLLATTDLHMHLTSYNYYADCRDPSVGLTRTATLIRNARRAAEAEGTTVLLFDNGDGLQGTPLGELDIDKTGRPHALMRAFEHLRYDAIGLGNHDFNFGLKTLTAVLRQAPCPVLSSNLRRLNCNGPPAWAPYAILDRIVRAAGAVWPIRIGVLSFLPPQTTMWDAHLLAGRVAVDDIVESARRWLPELRAGGCDLIVALAHCGLDAAEARDGMENAAIPLAALDGIDVVVAGHTHLQLPGAAHAGLAYVEPGTGAIHGKPGVMAGSAGSHLGVIDLELRAGRTGRWQVAGFETRLHPVARPGPKGAVEPLVEEDPELLPLLEPDHDETKALMRQPVGRTDTALHSYFTFFAPDRALALVAAAQAAALRPLLAGSGAESLPLLSVVSPGKFGARAGPTHFTDVPAGPVSLRNVADLHVFPNSVSALVLEGARILDWLEMSASLFHQIPRGSRDAALVDPTWPGHGFDVIHGLRYEVDLAAPARFRPDGTLADAEARRIRNATWHGRPIDPAQEFAVALNSYRASGGGNVAALTGARRIAVPRVMIRDALRDYLTGNLPRDPLEKAPAPWRFSPMLGTTAIALTGPGGARYLAELSHRGVRPLGLDACGFLLLSVPL